MTLNSRHILILLGISLAMSSCADFSMQDGKAELYPPVFKVDTHVEEIIQTKGDPGVPPLNVPATQDIHFTVKDKDGNTIYDKQGVWSEALKMPVGSYTVEASYGSNTFGAPYYKGSCSGTIASGREETPSITMSLCNALLATTLSEDLAVHFKADEVNPVRISTSSSSLDTGLGTYIFAPEGESLTVAISGQSSAGVAKTITHSIAPLTPATASYITCDLTTTKAPTITLKGTPEAWGTVGYIPVATTYNISEKNVEKMVYIAEASDDPSSKRQGSVEGTEVVFKNLTPGKSYSVYATIGALKSNQVEMTVATPEISISTGAKHTTNSSSELDGTDFTASISIPDKFKGVVANVKLTLSNGTTALREKKLSASETVWTSDGSVETAWPYLPQGSYTLKGTVSYNNESANADFTGPSLSVSAPTFTVNTPSAYTNYNTYLTSGAAAANNEDGSTIYEVGYSVSGISDKLLSNSNYRLACQYAINGTNVELTDGKITGCAWGENKLTATVTFAGTQKTSSALSCHITGLPYTAAPPTNTGAHLWTISRGKEKISFTNTYVEFTTSGTSKSDPLIQSPSFQIPANINVVVESSFILKANQVWPVTYNSEIFLWISGEKKYTKTHKSTTEKQYNESIEGIINTSKPYIEIEKNGTTALTGSAKFMSVIVKYR